MRAPERDPENRPLRMIPFMQAPGLCGPASLKIALSYFGKDFSEEELAKLAGASADYGTDHEPMIGALNALGATVFEKAGGTIDELKHFIQKERLPVIVGWWSCYGANPDFQNTMEDEGHFSVIYHISDQYVYLMDPAADACLSRLTLKKFLSLWFDTDTPENRRVDRWYIVHNFSGKIFNLPGGKNHHPHPDIAANLPSS
jgi:ABC-type bacteriocin/lantibiotic exporter with double-glycine peptidase domain